AAAPSRPCGAGCHEAFGAVRTTDWKNPKSFFGASDLAENSRRDKGRTACTHRKVEKSILFSTSFCGHSPQPVQCFLLMWVTCSVSASGAFFDRFSARRSLMVLPCGFLCSCLCGDLSGMTCLPSIVLG
ncbi:hypothetical protein, partial [Paeniglutamicibacter sp. NPDC091659]|uniref:hypothetical protein n=1 Tax=Paeniglutamicibacter sp. NPDC091659 TaxID=3364389 RepID=UPI003814B02C